MGYFHRCLSVNIWGYPISTPYYFHWFHVFSAVYSSNWSQAPSSQVPQSHISSTLVPSSRGYPMTGWGVYHSPQVRGYPSPRWFTSHLAKTRLGYPPQVRIGLRYPHTRTGVPLPIHCPVTGYAWTGYTMGGTPLAVFCRRTFLFSTYFHPFGRKTFPRYDFELSVCNLYIP